MSQLIFRLDEILLVIGESKQVIGFLIYWLLIYRRAIGPSQDGGAPNVAGVLPLSGPKLEEGQGGSGAVVMGLDHRSLMRDSGCLIVATGAAVSAARAACAIRSRVRHTQTFVAIAT